MTLILARASAEYILQVSDRLLTLNRQPFDRVANKSILFIASNAVVTVAYSGEAYLDNIPTDYLIAENLSGVKIDPKNPPLTQFGKNKARRDLGYAILSLRDELNIQNQRKLLRQRKSLDLIISIQGWQWDPKGRLRPLVASIERTSYPYDAFNVQYQPRYWWINGESMIISTPASNLSAEELTQLMINLRNKTALESEEILVEKIREKSIGSPWIGPHCMSILIPPPSDPNITVRYLPSFSPTLSASQRLPNNQQIVAFSPWILSPDICAPPGEIIGGGFNYTTGPFTIHFVCQTPEHPFWLLSHQGQKRPRRP